MHAEALALRLKALPALEMRRAVLREVICALPPQDAAVLLGEIVRRGPNGAPFDVALLALSAALDVGDFPYEIHGAIYTNARERGDESLAAMLLSAQPPPPGLPRAVPIPGKEGLTLGERKAYARGRKREILDRLLRDPDPTVVEILLANPRITEGDIVRLAARRPTTAEVQRRILSSRFITRYLVKRALVLNPFTPSDLAARLAPALTFPDLAEVAQDASLGDVVRGVAAALLNRPKEAR